MRITEDMTVEHSVWNGVPLLIQIRKADCSTPVEMTTPSTYGKPKNKRTNCRLKVCYLFFCVCFFQILLNIGAKPMLISGAVMLISGAGDVSSNIGPVKSDTVLPMACHRCNISSKGRRCVARRRNDMEMGPENSLHVSHNTASIMEDLILVWFEFSYSEIEDKNRNLCRISLDSIKKRCLLIYFRCRIQLTTTCT